MSDLVKRLTELKAKATKAKKSLGLGGWFVFPEDGFTFQITTASGPHRGLHIAQDMREEDAEFVTALVNAYPAIAAALEAAERLADGVQEISKYEGSIGHFAHQILAEFRAKMGGADVMKAGVICMRVGCDNPADVGFLYCKECR